MRNQDFDLDAITRRHAAARAFVVDDMRVRPTADVRDFFDQDVPDLIDALVRAGAVIRQNTITHANTERKLAEAKAELDAIGGMQVIEHEGCRLRIITSALHNRLCKWRVATPQGTDPEVLGCAGCGFCYPPVTDTRPNGSDGGGVR